MNVKTPEQLEDAAIADIIRSVVAMRTRGLYREMQNRIVEIVTPKIDMARLQGKRIDVDKLVSEVLREVTASK